MNIEIAREEWNEQLALAAQIHDTKVAITWLLGIMLFLAIIWLLLELQRRHCLTVDQCLAADAEERMVGRLVGRGRE